MDSKEMSFKNLSFVNSNNLAEGGPKKNIIEFKNQSELYNNQLNPTKIEKISKVSNDANENLNNKPNNNLSNSNSNIPTDKKNPTNYEAKKEKIFAKTNEKSSNVGIGDQYSINNVSNEKMSADEKSRIEGLRVKGIFTIKTI